MSMETISDDDASDRILLKGLNPLTRNNLENRQGRRAKCPANVQNDISRKEELDTVKYQALSQNLAKLKPTTFSSHQPTISPTNHST